MSFEKPPVVKYLSPSSKSRPVDLLNLCRRLIAEWQYHDEHEFGSFVRKQSGLSGAKVLQEYVMSSEVGIEGLSDFNVIQKTLAEVDIKDITPEMVPFLNELPITKYSIALMPKTCGMTAKDFINMGEAGDLEPEELFEIYWQLRLANSIIPVVVGQLVEEFKILKYDGWMLPNGKVVPFDAMHQIKLLFSPKSLHLVEFLDAPAPKRRYRLIERIAKFDKGFFVQHVAIAFNLPEKDEKGNFGRLMIIDPTSAQFGMKGRNGEIFYWGYYEDYVRAFPAKKVVLNKKGFVKHNHTDTSARFTLILGSPLILNAALSKMKSDSCHHCGEVERQNNPDIKLKVCSRCRKVFYCDGLCQKLGWKSHKLECKKSK